MISTYGIKTNKKHTIKKNTFTYREETKTSGWGQGGMDEGSGKVQCLCYKIRNSWGCNGGFPGGSVVEKLHASAGDPGSIPGSGRSPRAGSGNLLQYSCLQKSHGERSLVGYSPWGCKQVRPNLASEHTWGCSL